jgi:hypothetical protein
MGVEINTSQCLFEKWGNLYFRGGGVDRVNSVNLVNTVERKTHRSQSENILIFLEIQLPRKMTAQFLKWRFARISA